MEATPGQPVTPRQREVWRLAALGWGSKRIAYELGMSLQTVKNHISALHGILDVDNRIALAHAAVLLGVVSQEEVLAALSPQVLALRAEQRAQQMDDLLATAVEMGAYERRADQEPE